MSDGVRDNYLNPRSEEIVCTCCGNRGGRCDCERTLARIAELETKRDDDADLIDALEKTVKMCSCCGNFEARCDCQRTLARIAEVERQLMETGAVVTDEQAERKRLERLNTALDNLLREAVVERDELRAALVRRTGASSWQEWSGIWDPTEEAAIDAVKRLVEALQKAYWCMNHFCDYLNGQDCVDEVAEQTGVPTKAVDEAFIVVAAALAGHPAGPTPEASCPTCGKTDPSEPTACSNTWHQYARRPSDTARKPYDEDLPPFDETLGAGERKPTDEAQVPKAAQPSDTERLDWLLDQDRDYQFHQNASGAWVLSVDGNQFVSAFQRDCIDAAIAATQPAKEPNDGKD